MSQNIRDSRPIYEQVRDNLRGMILNGGLEPEQRLPSVRELAAQLQINPNTIQRAIRELELEGYIYTLPGKGSFVGQRQEVDSGRRRQLWHTFDATVAELLYLGVSAAELSAHIQGGTPT